MVALRGGTSGNTSGNTASATLPSGTLAGDRAFLFTAGNFGVDATAGDLASWDVLDSGITTGGSTLSCLTLTKVLDSGDISAGDIDMVAFGNSIGWALATTVGDCLYRTPTAEYTGVGDSSNHNFDSPSDVAIGDLCLIYGQVRNWSEINSNTGTTVTEFGSSNGQTMELNSFVATGAGAFTVNWSILWGSAYYGIILPLYTTAPAGLDVEASDVIRVGQTSLLNGKYNVFADGGSSQFVNQLLHGFGIDAEVLDTVGGTDTAVGFKGYFRTLTDGLVISSVLDSARFLALVVAEAVRLQSVTIAVRGISTVVTESIAVSSDLQVIYSLLLVERLRLNNTHVINWIANCSADELVEIAETLRQTLPVEITEGLEITLEQLVQTAIGILERMRAGDVLRGNAIYHVTVAQALRLRESLGNFFGADIAEGLAFADALAARALALAAVSERVGITAALTPQLLLHVHLAEGVEIDDQQIVNMLYNPLLHEGVVIEAGYVAPDGSLTTWVMNTRTAAVTEYSDFAFNSFARVGNHYLGASDEGLFELLGDDDDGDDILARIKGGYMQFGGTQLSRLKEAYIAATGEGRMILRIITKEGDIYNYGADTRDGRSTKVHMGKGQRSRYFAFELISAGQDFDLDTIEFVPLVVARRV
jgi:hypothetical protein